jgi:hypothetical protein
MTNREELPTVRELSPTDRRVLMVSLAELRDKLARSDPRIAAWIKEKIIEIADERDRERRAFDAASARFVEERLRGEDSSTNGS